VYEFNLQAAEIRDELTVRENFRNFILAAKKQMDDPEVLTGEAVGEVLIPKLEKGVEVPDKNVFTGTSPIDRIPKNEDHTDGEPEVKNSNSFWIWLFRSNVIKEGLIQSYTRSWQG